MKKGLASSKRKKPVLNSPTHSLCGPQFSPDGSVFVSASMDGTMFLFDGKTGEKTGTFGSPAHKGGIYSVSFSSNGSKILSGKPRFLP